MPIFLSSFLCCLLNCLAISNLLFFFLGWFYYGKNCWIHLGRIRHPLSFAWDTWCIWHHMLTILALGRCQKLFLETSYCFVKHQFVDVHMYFPKEEGIVQLSILEILFGSTLDMQWGFFKITIKSQAIDAMQLPFNGNPIIWLWHTISSFRMFCHNLRKYFKLVEIGSVLLLENVKDDICFWNLKFLKSRLCNRLGPNVPMVMRIFWQQLLTLVQLPYKDAIESSKNESKHSNDA